MKKLTVAALVLGLGAGSVSAQPLELQGSDTLFTMTQAVMAACGTDPAVLTYIGGGSTAGGNAMLGNLQSVSPMSRFMNASECNNGAEPDNAGRGCAFALDALSVWRHGTKADGNPVTLADGGTLRFKNGAEIDAMPVQDLNGIAGLQCPDCTGTDYQFADWRDALRIVYGGRTQHVVHDACNVNAPSTPSPNTKDCNSDVRHTLVANWGRIFENSTETGKTLWHAFRRDDVSGTTDVFLALLGLPSIRSGSGGENRPFCNGIENEDNDPIRRTCVGDGRLNGEQVCLPNNLYNLVTPFPTPTANVAAPASPNLVLPTSTGYTGRNRADSGLVLPVLVPENDAYPVDCDNTTTFEFAAWPNAGAPSPDTNCPDGTPPGAFGCYVPTTSDPSMPGGRRFGCRARANTVPLSIAYAGNPIVHMDGRGYNRIRYRFAGDVSSGQPVGILNTVPRRNAGGATVQRAVRSYYLMHQTAPMINTGTPADHPIAAGTNPAALDCEHPDATDQIGCLVSASPSSIGFAGLSGGTTTNFSLALGRPDGVGAADSSVSNMRLIDDGCPAAGGRYALTRFLYFNNIDGAINVPIGGDPASVAKRAAQTALENCYCNRRVTDPISILPQQDFVPIDATVCPDGGGACTTTGPAVPAPVRTCPP